MSEVSTTSALLEWATRDDVLDAMTADTVGNVALYLALRGTVWGALSLRDVTAAVQDEVLP